GGDGTLIPIFPVELDVESVVQKHAAQVKAGGTETEQEKSPHAAAAAEQPGRQAIRPHRRQVGNAPQHEQRPPIGRRLGPGQQQHGARPRKQETAEKQRRVPGIQIGGRPRSASRASVHSSSATNWSTTSRSFNSGGSTSQV